MESFHVRYFKAADKEDVLQVVKLYECNGDTTEQEEMRAAFAAQGIAVYEISREEFYYLLATNTTTKIERFDEWKHTEVRDAAGSIGWYDEQGRFRPDEAAAAAETCERCNGSGKVEIVSRASGTWLENCIFCEGTGKA